MIAALVAALIAGQAGAVEPVGSAKTIKWSGKQVGYHVDERDGVVLKVQGPGAVVLEVRGQVEKGKQLQLDLLRDDAHLSRNTVELKAKPAGGPKGFPGLARLSWLVPEGSHTYQITSGGKPLVVLLKPVPAVIVDAAAAPEQSLDGGSASSAPASAATSAKAPPASTAAPAPVSAAAIVAAPQTGLEGLALEAKAAPSGAADTTSLQKAIRVAVYDLELQGIEPSIGAVVTDSLLSEVRKLQRVSAIGMDEIRDMLSHEANKQVLGCEENEACLAEIAGALGVDNLVTGTLSRVDDGNVFLLRRIDQNRAKVVGTVDKRLKAGSGQEFLAAVGPSIEELFPEHPIREGMTRGVPKEMALRLDPPPLPRWSFWTAASATLATLAGAGFYGYLAKESEREWNAQFDDNQVVAGSTLGEIGDRAHSREKMANTLFISSAVVAVASGVMALFTDWHGYGDAAAGASAN